MLIYRLQLNLYKFEEYKPSSALFIEVFVGYSGFIGWYVGIINSLSITYKVDSAKTNLPPKINALKSRIVSIY